MELKEIMQALADYTGKLEQENRELRELVKVQAENKIKYGSLADLPDVLTAQEIASYLRLKRDTVYAMLHKPAKDGGIPTLRGGLGGKTLRVIKTDFMSWLNTQRTAAPGDTVAEDEPEMPTRIIKGRRRRAI